MRVLIVEDDSHQRRVLALVVQGHGHEVVECAGLAAARAAPRCDLALVDRHLPDGDGLALARELKGRVYGRVYVLTGDDHLAVNAENAGLRVLLKPVRPADLDRLLSE